MTNEKVYKGNIIFGNSAIIEVQFEKHQENINIHIAYSVRKQIYALCMLIFF